MEEKIHPKIKEVQEKEKQKQVQSTTEKINLVTLRIKKYNPNNDAAPTYKNYEVPVEKWTTVLDALLDAKQNLDHSIGVRYSCRQASCGSCGMKINGKPKLACFTKISELDSREIVLEPMDNFPIIRDLAVNFSRMFANHKKIMPYVMNDESEISNDAKEFLQNPNEVEEYIQFAGCIKCGLCNSACPTMSMDSSFIGPQALAQAYRYVADNRDNGTKNRLRVIDESHGIWRCHFAGSCSEVCPKGVDPAMGIQLLRGYLLGFRE